MKYNKGFIGIGIIIAIVATLVVGGGAVYFATKTPTSPKNIGENNYQPQENQNQNGVLNTPVENNTSNISAQNNQVISTPKNEKTADIVTTTTALENIKTPLFIKSVYQKDGKWWADVDYITKVTPLEHMTKEINEGFCVIPGMTKSEMLTYAKNTVKNYVEQDNLLVVNCGYDWQGIWSSDGEVPSMFINSSPLIRSLPFAEKIEREIKICGVSSISTTTPEKIKMEVDNRRGLDYSFDPYIQTYNTKGHLEELVIIENGQIKRFYGPDGCAG